MNALVLYLIAGGGSIAAAFVSPAGWLVTLAYIAGSAGAWILYGSAVQLAHQRAQAAVTARAAANPGQLDALRKWIEQQQSVTNTEELK